jgi:hypothetical protein
MKAFVAVNVIIIIATFLISCGYQETLRRHCSIGDTQTCDNLFGRNQEEVDAAQDARLSSNEKEIESLSTMVQELLKDIAVIESQVAQTNIMINLLHSMAQQQSADINAINQMLVDMNQDLVDLQEKVAYEQTRVNAMQIEINQLQSEDSVVESIYPCGDNANKFDEAILKTRSGKLIVYFESGGNRFLTRLSPGAYRTTDYAPYCNFTVNAQMQIVNGSR